MKRSIKVVIARTVSEFRHEAEAIHADYAVLLEGYNAATDNFGRPPEHPTIGHAKKLWATPSTRLPGVVIAQVPEGSALEIPAAGTVLLVSDLETDTAPDSVTVISPALLPVIVDLDLSGKHYVLGQIRSLAASGTTGSETAADEATSEVEELSDVGELHEPDHGSEADIDPRGGSRSEPDADGGEAAGSGEPATRPARKRRSR